MKSEGKKVVKKVVDKKPASFRGKAPVAGNAPQKRNRGIKRR